MLIRRLFPGNVFLARRYANGVPARRQITAANPAVYKLRRMESITCLSAMVSLSADDSGAAIMLMTGSARNPITAIADTKLTQKNIPRFSITAYSVRAAISPGISKITVSGETLTGMKGGWPISLSTSRPASGLRMKAAKATAASLLGALSGTVKP